MDAVEFIKEYSRLCNTYKNCTKCPFRENPCGTDCEWTLGFEEKIVSIVEQWSKSHPQKTMIQDFFEKFPNAPRAENDTPRSICPSDCGYTNEPESYRICEKFNDDCAACWSRPLEE